MSFCSLIKGITPKISMSCFVLINSVPSNLLCIWIREDLRLSMVPREEIRWRQWCETRCEYARFCVEHICMHHTHIFIHSLFIQTSFCFSFRMKSRITPVNVCSMRGREALNTPQPQPDQYIFIYHRFTVVKLLRCLKKGFTPKICACFALSY